MHYTMATKKKQQAKKSDVPGECVRFDGCTSGATVVRAAECVRCVRAVRRKRSAAEIVRTRSKCVTAPTPQATTARPRPARPTRPSTSHRHAKSDLAKHQPGASGTSRLSRPCKLLRLSRLPITMHNVRHMEWRFYSEKPATGGEGVRPGITTATTTHTPPQTFFCQLAPFALACIRRHATFPYVVQDTSASVFPFWGAR
jgi:hypothetical protein